MDASKFEKDLDFTTSALFRLVNKIASQEHAFTGLTPSYAFLIVAVKESPGIRATELSKKLHLEASTITRLIEKLETRNFIIRDSSPGMTKVYLTESGQQMYNNVIIGMENYLNQFKAALGKKQYKELVKSISSALVKLKTIPIVE
jgi:DNA-binding MarR family transcriptional regulator